LGKLPWLLRSACKQCVFNGKFVSHPSVTCRVHGGIVPVLWKRERFLFRHFTICLRFESRKRLKEQVAECGVKS